MQRYTKEQKWLLPQANLHQKLICYFVSNVGIMIRKELCSRISTLFGFTAFVLSLICLADVLKASFLGKISFTSYYFDEMLKPHWKIKNHGYPLHPLFVSKELSLFCSNYLCVFKHEFAPLLSKKKIDSLTPSDLNIPTRKIGKLDIFEQTLKKSQHCVLHTLEQVASLTAEKEIVGVASAKFEKFLQWKQARRRVRCWIAGMVADLKIWGEGASSNVVGIICPLWLK